MSPTMPPIPGRGGILSLALRTKEEIYQCYMPFIRGGGLFVPTSNSHSLGDEVFVLVSFLDEKEQVPVAGKVVWVTPMAAQGHSLSGIGIAIDDASGTIRERIEGYLAGMNFELPTKTM